MMYSVPIVECEIITEKEGVKPSKAIIKGTCLVPTISRNGNEYSIKNIKENDGKEVKFFVQEHGALEVKNIVGKAKLVESEGKLNFIGEIRNTTVHPDIVEHALNKEVDVSIDARYNGRRVVEKDSKKHYSYDSIDIRAMCGVGIGGIPQNSMECVIAESFNDSEICEVNKLDESEQLKVKIAEMEKMLKDKELVIAEHQNADKARADAERAIIVESIKKCKKDFVDNERPISELKLILEYEQKTTKVEEKEGKGIVENVVKTKVDDNTPGILVNESEDTITMNPAKYAEFIKPNPLYR